MQSLAVVDGIKSYFLKGAKPDIIDQMANGQVHMIVAMRFIVVTLCTYKSIFGGVEQSWWDKPCI